MRKTLDHCYYHLIWRTYKAVPLINVSLRQKIWGLWQILISNMGCTLIAVALASDHIHLLLQIPPTRSVSSVVHQLKGSSSHWLNHHFNACFKWQKGYGVYSVSKSIVPKVKQYILNHIERADKSIVAHQ